MIKPLSSFHINCHYARFSDNHNMDYYQALLSEDEKARAGRFYFDPDRANYIIARGILRSLLGQYLRQAPDSIEFCYNSYGKPMLRAEQNPLNVHFNMSHSEDIACYVFTTNAAIGVDIEYQKTDLDYLAIARRFFSDTEALQLIQLPTDLQREAFYKIWTSKEAFVKAEGSGLLYALNKFSVDVDPHKPARLIEWADTDDISNWSFQTLNIADKYSAALATMQPIEVINYYPYALHNFF